MQSDFVIKSIEVKVLGSNTSFLGALKGHPLFTPREKRMDAYAPNIRTWTGLYMTPEIIWQGTHYATFAEPSEPRVINLRKALCQQDTK